MTKRRDVLASELGLIYKRVVQRTPQLPKRGGALILKPSHLSRCLSVSIRNTWETLSQ